MRGAADASAKRHPGRRQVTKSVSATELVQMGTCERMVWLEHRLGRRSTADQDRARLRGTQAHERFYAQSKRLMTSGRDRPGGRCFIAMLTLGEGAELDCLRAWRDQALRPHPLV